MNYFNSTLEDLYSCLQFNWYHPFCRSLYLHFLQFKSPSLFVFIPQYFPSLSPPISTHQCSLGDKLSRQFFSSIFLSQHFLYFFTLTVCWIYSILTNSLILFIAYRHFCICFKKFLTIQIVTFYGSFRQSGIKTIPIYSNVNCYSPLSKTSSLMIFSYSKLTFLFVCENFSEFYDFSMIG